MKLWRWWQRHRTWVLGTSSSIIGGFLLIDQLIPPEHAKYWQAANLVLTVLIAQGGITSAKTPKQGPTP